MENIEKEIDLLELGSKLWGKRMFIIKISIIGFVVGVIIAFSIPKEYTTSVILAPESSSKSGGGVGALAAMAGIELGGGGGDALLSPTLYPTIASSTPFVIGLFDIGVKDEKENINTTLYNYIKEGQKSAWWSYIIGTPIKLLGLFSNKSTVESTVDRFALTASQMGVLNTLKGRIQVVADKKSGIVTLSVTMQNPQISAHLADTLTEYLQSYIINYRTQKARQDLIFSEQLYEQAKKDYSDAQQKYARFLDQNQNVILASYKVNQEKLQNEANLAFGIYNQVAQQLQMAKVKMQDLTPVYTVVQPAVQPLIPEKPNKKLIIIGFSFLSLIISCSWILGREFFNAQRK